MNANHVMYKLFRSFETNNILYVHFKSNTNLCESFSGRGDFDVLVDKSRILDVERLISENNGKRHNPVHVGNYAGVDNWLVFDDADGNYYHLHLHYQLVTGKKFVKDYVIPWNDLLLTTRVKDSEYGIYVTNPNLELILLAFRVVLKAKLFDFQKKLVGLYKLDKGMQREWDDLFAKSSSEILKNYIDKVCPDNGDYVFDILSKAKLTSWDYLRLHRYIRKTMKIHRRYSGLEAMVRTSLYQSENFLCRAWNKFFDGRRAITKKTSLQGGLIIAFIGVDGSGKSTLSNEISKWTRKKIECKRFYMGTGDGKTTLYTSVMKRLIKSRRHNNKRVLQQKEVQISSTTINFFNSPLKFIKKYLILRMISSVQKNNYYKIKKMYQYKLNGGVCILDRWPQVEKEKQNDGPKIVCYKNVFGEKPFLKRMIKQENERLGIVKTIKPDIIFRLNISLDTCMTRKTEHVNKDYFERKIIELNQLNFQGANIVEVDAEQSYETELLFIKRILWKYI